MSEEKKVTQKETTTNTKTNTNTNTNTNTSSERPFQRRYRRFSRRKICVFCADKLTEIDYKDINRLKKFITEKGKILPRRQTGNCATHQRKLSVAVKRARYMALVPYVGD